MLLLCKQYATGQSKKNVRIVQITINFFYNGSIIKTTGHFVQFNIRHLLSALEIRECGTVTQASKQIHLSQSALTQAINKLESQLDIQLFERTNSGMFTTPSGELFLERVKRAFSYLETAAHTLFDTDKAKRLGFLRNVTLRQLTALITIVELQNYTAAAVKLSLTQPTLGKTIKDLEHLTEQRLFNRVPTGVEPTWRARQLSRFASLFFAEIHQGEDEVNRLKGQRSGSVSVGSLPLARTAIVPDTVTALLQAYPDVKVSIIDGPYEEQLSALLHGQLDIIVGALRVPSPSNDIEQHRLFDDSLSVVARVGHPATELFTQPVTQTDLTQYQWIAPRQGTPTRAVFSQFFQARGLTPPQDVVECSSLVAVRGLLLNSDRITLLPARQVAVEVRSGLLAISSQPLPDSKREIGYTLRKNWKPTPVQARFIELLSDIAR